MSDREFQPPGIVERVHAWLFRRKWAARHGISVAEFRRRNYVVVGGDGLEDTIPAAFADTIPAAFAVYSHSEAVERGRRIVLR